MYPNIQIPDFKFTPKIKTSNNHIKFNHFKPSSPGRDHLLLLLRQLLQLLRRRAVPVRPVARSARREERQLQLRRRPDACEAEIGWRQKFQECLIQLRSNLRYFEKHVSKNDNLRNNSGIKTPIKLRSSYRSSSIFDVASHAKCAIRGSGFKKDRSFSRSFNQKVQLLAPCKVQLVFAKKNGRFSEKFLKLLKGAHLLCHRLRAVHTGPSAAR